MVTIPLRHCLKMFHCLFVFFMFDASSSMLLCSHFSKLLQMQYVPRAVHISGYIMELAM